MSICDEALALFNQDPASYSERSSARCALLIDSVRRRQLTLWPWFFARRRTNIVCTQTPNIIGYEYSCTLPSDCLQIVYCLENNEYLEDYTRIDNKLYTNTTFITVVHTVDTGDYSTMPPWFYDLLKYALAIELIPALASNYELAQNLREVHGQKLLEARKIDIMQGPPFWDPGLKICKDVLALLKLAPEDYIFRAGERVQQLLPAIRKAQLSQHSWVFARKNTTLSPSGTPISGFSSSYTLPTDCLYTVTRTYDNTPVHTFSAVGNKIYTNTPSLTLLYISDYTDYKTMPPWFYELIKYALASELLLSFTLEKDSPVDLSSIYKARLQEAIKINAMQAPPLWETGNELCNEALALLNELPEDFLFRAAERSTQIIDNVRRAQLIKRPWVFARKNIDLSPSGNSISGFTSVYSLPADCLYIVNRLANNDVVNDYNAIGNKIYTNTSTLSLIYTSDYTDYKTMPPWFYDLLKCALAKELVSAFTSNHELAQQLAQQLHTLYESKWQEANKLDAMQAPPLWEPGACICNDALALLGEMPEDFLFRASERCTQVLAGVRRNQLTQHPWYFARNKVALSPIMPLHHGHHKSKYHFTYNLPSSCLYIVTEDMDNEFLRAYNIQGSQLLCNCPKLILTYIQDITDYKTMPPWFYDVLKYALAQELISAFTANHELAQLLSQQIRASYQEKLRMARHIDAVQGPRHRYNSDDPRYSNQYISVRWM